MPGRSQRDRPDPRADYASSVSGSVPPYLLHVERQTYLKTLAPQQMSSRLQGRILAMLSSLRQPHRLLEIGTFTGYATLCLAEGLAENGTIDTIEGDPEMAWLAYRHFRASPFADQIRLHVGQANDLLAELPGSYDLIFLDADKRGYPGYVERLVNRLTPGGLLLADNVLWDGKVGKRERDTDSHALHHYNRLLQEDPRVSVVVLPLRDGLSLARRR